MRIWTRLLAIGAVAVGSFSAGCSPAAGPGSASISPPSAAVASASATARPSWTPGPGDVVFAGVIDVGDDRRLEVRCVGIGTPTVLLEGGGLDPSLDEYPEAFVDDLGETTTTCHYSRAGGGASDPLPGTRTMTALTDDVYALLAALKLEANVQGPYVFAGWSFGGTIALATALAKPDETAGLVILDTDFIADFMTTCRASGRTEAECKAEYDADVDALSLEKELLRQIHPLPNIPLQIVTAMDLPGCDPSDPDTRHVVIDGKDVIAKDCPTLADLIARAQLDGWSTINPKLEQTLVDAGHDGLIDAAGEEIADVIREVVLEARVAS
jgi:pimeloyl-ACP methyl ester carboxylesterase